MRAAFAVIVLAACGPPHTDAAEPHEVPVVAVDAAPADAAPADASGAGITPTAYTVELAIDPAASGYTGKIAIDVAIASRASAIWLDAADLEIESARLTIGDDVRELHVIEGAPAERLGLALDEPVEPGDARLELAFTGTYRSDDGIFAQTYRAGTYVFSDFEPMDARRGFPCFDEPRFKTPWTVSLVVPDGLVALSNTDATATDDLAGALTRVTFATTPALPSYLVAVAVGDFELVDAPGGPRPMRIVVPRGRADAAARAAEYAPALLDTAQAFLDRDVPFAKLDVIAVPRFGGAMENPGLITVALDILLDGRTDADRRRLALVLAHELSHLWFGDSVTPVDWRDLWINEGVATWMADEVLARWHPSWNTRLGEIGARFEAMAEDDAPGAHALRPDVLDGPRALFDVLTYLKGSSLLHMMEAWRGEDAFVGALRDYLDVHAGGGVSSEDLLVALGPEVWETMQPLLEHAGVPVVDAKLACDAAGARLALVSRSGPAIPVCARWRDADGEHRACTKLVGEGELALGATCPTWVQPNADGEGYYRWWLDGGDLAAVIADAHASDRDRLEAARAVRQALADGTPVRQIARALAAGARSSVLEIASAAIADYRVLIDQVAPDDAVKPIAAHLRKAIAPAVKRLGTAPRASDTDVDRAMRALVLGAAGLAGDPKVIAWATKAARRWLDHGHRPPDELAEPVLLTAAAHADVRLAKALVDAAAHVMDDAGDDAPLFGRALGRLPHDRALAVLTANLAGALPSMITFTQAIEQLTRRDLAADTAAQLAGQGDWLAIALTFAPVCDPTLVDRTSQPDTLARRRADATRCAALAPRLADAAKAFK